MPVTQFGPRKMCLVTTVHRKEAIMQGDVFHPVHIVRDLKTVQVVFL